MTSTYLGSPRFRLEARDDQPDTTDWSVVIGQLAAAPSKMQPIGSGAYLPTVDMAGQSRHPGWRKGNLELTPAVDDIVEFLEERAMAKILDSDETARYQMKRPLSWGN
ncbi:hypothetical protein CPLU01_02459 [Colletotrichum plurivorum]|uniref:Uncharacterized protein n=1 Tax=Colletotrichum plurivorum TaxID=2175906 RepID=A0A8H6KVB6_9PEZI|nr:hypothetical protein CPLU01_02459 [Colletotrichum plurivorum]